MKSLQAALVAAAALSVISSGAHANVLTNGSLEGPTGFVDNANHAMLLNVGSTAINGWTVIGNGTVLWAGPGSLAYMGNLGPSTGNYFVDLTGLTNIEPAAGLSQSITTIAGEQYALSFDFEGRNDSTPVGITAAATGVASQNFTTNAFPPSAYGNATWTFTAAVTGTTTISLSGYLAGLGGYDISLDNVDLELTRAAAPATTPLPSSWLMLLSGLAGFGFVAHRRQKRIVARIAA
jgi:hypothetical protein